MSSTLNRKFAIISICILAFLLIQGSLLAQEDRVPVFPEATPELGPDELQVGTADIVSPEAAAAVVTDESFELGSSEWLQHNDALINCNRIGNFSSQTGVSAKDGSKYAWIGGRCNGVRMGVNNARQMVTIPKGDPVLIFWYYMKRTETNDPDPNSDLAYVKFGPTIIWERQMTKANNTNGWVKKTVSLKNFAGQTNLLKMAGRNWPPDTGGDIYYDLVQINGPDPVNDPLMEYRSYTIDDDGTNQSGGNNDGRADCGEDIELIIKVKNSGSGAATNFHMSVSENDSYIDFFSNSDTSTIGSIASGATWSSLHPDDFDLRIASNAPNGRNAKINLTMYASNGGPWTTSFNLPLYCSLAAPSLDNIRNSDGDGSYTVTWSSVSGADSYTLEEQFNGGSWTGIYSGSNTSFYRSGKAYGRWCYRANASDSTRTSSWSSTKCVDIVPPSPRKDDFTSFIPTNRSLYVSYLSGNREIEPNNKSSQANGVLRLGEIYRGSFANAGDANDYYHFRLVSRDRVSIKLADIPGDHNFDLVLRDNIYVEEEVGYSGELGNSNESINMELAPGWYFIQIYNRSNKTHSKLYSLEVDYAE